MFKLCFILFIATLALFPHLCNAECCYSNTIHFTPNGKTCEQFGASNLAYTYQCEKDICGDGKELRVGYYCGKGPCNIVGCNCEGGCIEGNAIERFRRIHGNNVSDVLIQRNPHDFHYMLP